MRARGLHPPRRPYRARRHHGGRVYLRLAGGRGRSTRHRARRREDAHPRTLADFDYDEKPASVFEVPIAERIAAIRAQKADDRARSKAKAERKAQSRPRVLRVRPGARRALAPLPARSAATAPRRPPASVAVAAAPPARGVVVVAGAAPPPVAARRAGSNAPARTNCKREGGARRLPLSLCSLPSLRSVPLRRAPAAAVWPRHAESRARLAPPRRARPPRAG